MAERIAYRILGGIGQRDKTRDLPIRNIEIFGVLFSPKLAGIIGLNSHLASSATPPDEVGPASRISLAEQGDPDAFRLQCRPPLRQEWSAGFELNAIERKVVVIITGIDVCPLTGATVDGGWPQGHEPQENLHTLVIVHTDSSHIGFGSCFTSGKLIVGAVELLWPLLKGELAIEPERVSEKLHQSTFWQGRGGSVTHAISGIDIALWDLMGKACGQPVSRLMGGNYRDRIKPYGSILFDEPAALAKTLESVVARGFKAIKMGWRPFGRRDRAFDELLIQTARDTVGDNVELMVDAGGSEQFWPHGTNWARNTAMMLADYDITWFEEALPPDDINGFVELTRVSPVPISGGEVLTRRQSFQPWLERHAVDIIQPDVTKNGGLSEFRRIAQLAQDHNVQVVPHGWNTAVGLAADLQISAFLPVARYVEYLTPCAYIDELPADPFIIDSEGFLKIPSRPGLGIDIDPARLKRFCPNRVEFR